MILRLAAQRATEVAFNALSKGGDHVARRGVAVALAFLAGCASAPPRSPIVQPPGPHSTHTIMVRVFKGPVARDEKGDGAAVSIAGRSLTADGAGNVDVADLAAGSYEACAAIAGWKRTCVSGAVPGPPIDIALERDVPPIQPVRIDGRFWITDAGTFRPCFQSGLALLVRGPPERTAFLDQTAALGFNGVRVFAGALAWAPQTVEQARAALPALLDEAAARGLYVYAVALTDSGTGYDIEAHLRAVAGICAAHANCLLEVANEIGHPTQSSRVNDIPWLLALARRMIPPDVMWALGSTADEPQPDGTVTADGGSFNTGHLDRSRDLYNQVRRIREIAAMSEAARKPAMSGEPIGIAEVPMPGRQRLWGDEALTFSFAYGALCRGFEVGCVFHSEQGLRGEVLGPNTAAAARVFVEGWRAIEFGERLQFVNAGWVGSPVARANFETGVVRAYSFVAATRGRTALIGLKGDPAIEWGGGWRPFRTVAERPGVRLVEIER